MAKKIKLICDICGREEEYDHKNVSYETIGSDMCEFLEEITYQPERKGVQKEKQGFKSEHVCKWCEDAIRESVREIIKTRLGSYSPNKVNSLP